MGTKNESVVFSQRKRISGERVERGVFETQRRLNLAGRLLLAEDVSDVIGAESACGMGLGERIGYRRRAVFTDETEQFTDLAREGAIGVGEPFEITLSGWSQKLHQALLGRRALCRSHLREQFFLPLALRARPF